MCVSLGCGRKEVATAGGLGARREILEVWEEEYLGSIKFSTSSSFVFQVFVCEVDITALNY